MRRLIVGFAMLMSSACAAVQPATRSESNPIPWLPLAADLTPPSVASPQPIPIPAGTQACRAQDLTAIDSGSQGATGHVVTSIVFAGRGTSACFLDGTPTVSLLDAAGHDVGFSQHSPYFPAEVVGPALIEPGPAPTPHTGVKYGQAWITIDWVSQPEACLGSQGVSIATAKLGIPGDSALWVPVGGAPAGYACQGVGASSFEGPPAPVQSSPQPSLPAISLQAPTSAKAGQHYRYVVTLTNDSAAAMDLAADCPNYFEALVTPDTGLSITGKQFYRLNCGPAGTIASGRSARFAIELDVPSSVQPGPYDLMFDLGYWNAMSKLGPPAVRVTVH